jgi:hypothetical protein
MKHIGDLVSKAPSEKEAAAKANGSRKTERGELMRYFQTYLNATRAKAKLALITMPRMGKILEGIPTKDLYYLKSVCEKAKNFSKKFWYEVDPKKHTPEARASQPF